MTNTYDSKSENIADFLLRMVPVATCRRFIETDAPDVEFITYIVGTGLGWRGTVWTDADTAALVKQVARAIYVGPYGGRYTKPWSEIAAMNEVAA